MVWSHLHQKCIWYSYREDVKGGYYLVVILFGKQFYAFVIFMFFAKYHFVTQKHYANNFFWCPVIFWVLISMYLCILNRWEQYYYAPASATFSGIQILSVTNYIPCLFYTCYNTLLKGNIVIRALFVL